MACAGCRSEGAAVRGLSEVVVVVVVVSLTLIMALRVGVTPEFGEKKTMVE